MIALIKFADWEIYHEPAFDSWYIKPPAGAAHYGWADFRSLPLAFEYFLTCKRMYGL